MVKLVDMPDLGSGAARRVGSSPIIRTEKASEKSEAFLFSAIFNIARGFNRGILRIYWLQRLKPLAMLLFWFYFIDAKLVINKKQFFHSTSK